MNKSSFAYCFHIFYPTVQDRPEKFMPECVSVSIVAKGQRKVTTLYFKYPSNTSKTTEKLSQELITSQQRREAKQA